MSSKALWLLCLFGLILTGRVLAEEEEEEGDEEELEEDEEEEKEVELDHGFGKEIDWVSWDEAMEVAEETDKPVFLLIHKSWCHACQALKKKVVQPSFMKEWKKMSENFVMVNTEDDEEPWEERYQPDGKYIPRTFFIKPNGELMDDITNKKPEYKNYLHYFATPADLMDAMKTALTKMGRFKNGKLTDEGKKVNPNWDKPEPKKEEAKPPGDVPDPQPPAATATDTDPKPPSIDPKTEL